MRTPQKGQVECERAKILGADTTDLEAFGRYAEMQVKQQAGGPREDHTRRFVPLMAVLMKNKRLLYRKAFCSRFWIDCR